MDIEKKMWRAYSDYLAYRGLIDLSKQLEQRPLEKHERLQKRASIRFIKYVAELTNQRTLEVK